MVSRVSLMIAFLSTIVRYYDYALFSLSAGILAKNFMPGNESEKQVLTFFAVLSISTLARPLGSLVFGKIGDMVGRVHSIRISAMLAGISTIVIGLMPSFDKIGHSSMFILSAMRMLFLTSLAGEIDAVKIYVVEKVGSKHRYLVSGVLSFTSQIGVVSASMACYVSALFSSEIEWLWRVNFLIGGVMGVTLFSLRHYLMESEYFLQCQANSRAKNGAKNSSIYNLLWRYKKQFLVALLINGLLGGNYHFLIIFLGTFYANIIQLISPSDASLLNMMLAMSYAFGSIFSGYITNKFRFAVRGWVILTLSALASGLSVLILLSIGTTGLIPAWIHIIIVFIVPLYAVPLAVWVQSLFPALVKMRLYSLSHSLGSMMLSSTTPFITMLIWNKFHSCLLLLIYFLCQIIALLMVYSYAIFTLRTYRLKAN